MSFPHGQHLWTACTPLWLQLKDPPSLPARNRYSRRAGQVPYDARVLAEGGSTHQVQNRERCPQKRGGQHRLWGPFLSVRKCSRHRAHSYATVQGLKDCIRDCFSQHFPQDKYRTLVCSGLALHYFSSCHTEYGRPCTQGSKCGIMATFNSFIKDIL